MPFARLTAADPLRELQGKLRQAFGDPPHVRLDEDAHRYYLPDGSELPSVGAILRGGADMNGYSYVREDVLDLGRRVGAQIAAAELCAGFCAPPDDDVAPFFDAWKAFSREAGWRTLAAEHPLCGLAPLTFGLVCDIFDVAAPLHQLREASCNGTNAPSCSAPDGAATPPDTRREAPPPLVAGGGAPFAPYAGTPDLVGVMTSPPPWLGDVDLYVLELKMGSIPTSGGPQAAGYLVAAHQLAQARIPGGLRVAAGVLRLPKDGQPRIARKRRKGDEERAPLVTAGPWSFEIAPEDADAAHVTNFRPVAARDVEAFLEAADRLRRMDEEAAARDTFTGGDADPHDRATFEPPELLPGEGAASALEAAP
jgi:hypothetical protein